MDDEDYFKQQITDFVDIAAKSDDLKSILSTVPMKKIQNFLNQHINTLNLDQSKKLFYSSLPITQLLNIDVVQYILSFNLSNEINAVSKTFQHLSLINQYTKTKQNIQNKITNQIGEQQLKYLQLQHHEQQVSKLIKHSEKHLSQLKKKQREFCKQLHDTSTELYLLLKKQTEYQQQQSAENTDNNSLFEPFSTIKYINNYNKTWVVRPKEFADYYEKSKYAKQHRQANDNGPYDHIMNCINKCKSGDKILAYTGGYLWQEDSYIDLKNKDLQIIGVDENVIYDARIPFVVGENCNIYIENIHFYAFADGHSDFCCSRIDIGNNSKVWLKNCQFRYDDALFLVQKNASLYVDNCLFIGYQSAENAINISAFANEVNVLNSTFSNIGARDVSHLYKSQVDGQHSCIDIGLHCKDLECGNRNKKASLKLVCIGNTFLDNYGYPIAKKHYIDVDMYHYDGYNYDRRYEEVPENVEPDELYWFNRYEQKDCLLTDNILKGYNGLDINETVDDANVLYQHQIELDY
eukprot:304965_1